MYDSYGSRKLVNGDDAQKQQNNNRAHDVTSLGDQHQDHRTRNGNDQRRFNLQERLRDQQGAEPQNSACDWPKENEIHSSQPRVGTAIENDGSGPGKPQDQRGTKKQDGTE